MDNKDSNESNLSFTGFVGRSDDKLGLMVEPFGDDVSLISFCLLCTELSNSISRMDILLDFVF